MFSAYDRLMATLDSVKFASYVFGQFGYDLAAFWVTYTGADSLMVEMLLGNIVKQHFVPLFWLYYLRNVNRLFMFTHWSKMACFEYRGIKVLP